MSMTMIKTMLTRKRKQSEIEYAFPNKTYFFEDIDTTIPWIKVRYSIL